MANIAVICDREFFQPFDQRVYKEVLTLKKAGHNVEIITPHNTTKTKEIEGIKVHCLTKEGVPGSTAYRLIKKALENNYDLYYCHELDPLIYSFFLRWATRKPIIWDCHEYLVPMKKELQGNLAAVLTDIAIRIAAPRVNHIVTVDNLLGRQLASLNNTTVIPNYPTLADFPVAERIPDKKIPNLLYVGGLTEERGLKVMLKALKIVKSEIEVKLTLVGGFYDKELENWAKNYDKKNDLDIEWVGWVNYRDLAPIFSRATLGLCLLQDQARYDRAIATKIFEYLLMGVPVLTSNGYLVEKLIQKAECGNAVNATNISEVAEGMITLLGNSDLEKMGKRGADFSRDKFVWEKRETNLLKIIEEMI